PSPAELLGRQIEADPDVHQMVENILQDKMVKHQMLADYLRLKKESE
ncbi:MAG: hypothetical protein GY765_43695, partial [bacterium]|nr:hypothetical protein [bacterium]